MVEAQTVLESFATALHDSGRFPDEMTYATLELDADGEHADVEPPIVEITMQQLERSSNRNTELVRHETDANGNHIGRIYRSLFRLQARFDLLSAAGSQYDARDLGQSLRTAFVEYDTRQMGQHLPDPDADTGVLTDISPLMVQDESRPNDLSMTPALRRTRTFVECWFTDEYSSLDYTSAEDYITDYQINTTVYEV